MKLNVMIKTVTMTTKKTKDEKNEKKIDCYYFNYFRNYNIKKIDVLKMGIY